MNVAVTCVSAVSVKVQFPVPPHPPPYQPANCEPASGTADNVTGISSVNGPVQALPQEMPAGELVTVPEPVPVLATMMAGSIPLPFSTTLALGVAGALEVIVKVAFLDPDAVGLNAT